MITISLWVLGKERDLGSNSPHFGVEQPAKNQTAKPPGLGLRNVFPDWTLSLSPQVSEQLSLAAVLHHDGFHLIDGMDSSDWLDLLFFGEGLPDLVDAADLHGRWKLGETIAKPLDRKVLLHRHGSELADGLLERVDSGVVWSDLVHGIGLGLIDHESA